MRDHRHHDQRLLTPVTAAIVPLLATLSATATTLEVGPAKPYATPCAAAAVAGDGDEILIDAGEYPGDVCAWYADDLTIRGVGGLATIDAAGNYAEGKAIWVIKGDNTTVESIEFLHCAVPDANGAGIRQEGTGLTVRYCVFRDNEDGILAGDNADSDIVIEYCEFDHNGHGDGYSHNLYINHVRSLTFRFNYSHDAYIGHNLKSRAYTNYILYNRIMDEADGRSSYVVNLPNGGRSYLIGNLIQQGADAENSGIVSVAEEGATNPTQELYIVNNSLLNERGAGTFIRNGSSFEAVITNNIFVGPGTILDGPGAETASLITDDPGWVDQAGYDFDLLDTSAAIDAGVDPGSGGGMSLWPESHYVHPANGEGRPVVGAIDIGAYEWGEGAADDDDDTAGDDDDATDDDDAADDDVADDDAVGDDDVCDDCGGQGCDCQLGGAEDGAPALLAALIGIATLARRRRR